ncbi:LAQU0S07e00716g1_1 [Lachancea quebecensis]|uniref:pH-response regulator protein palH/RIM21 n=1 Tax=Lachancea quebecensis TaxID=1654605 RepID=A0A0P1KUK4_9SACH|nr:LAQU0S07e00716g1_1 [Lachancea quebecensis]
MVKKTSWRYSQVPKEYPSCEGLNLGNGVLIWKDKWQPVAYFDNVRFTSYCDDSNPVYSSLKRSRLSFPYLESLQNDWVTFTTSGNDRGPFKYSIYAIIMSFTTNFVITLFLTVIVFITIRQKPHRGASNLLKLGSTLASVNLAIFISKALKVLHHDHICKGVVSTERVLNLLWMDLTFTCLDLLVILICQLCQVQIIMRLFSRVKEKRTVFLVGVTLSIISQVLWAIPTLAQSINDNYPGLSYDADGLTLLSPFVYLFRIALAASYACIICYNMFNKRHLCILYQRMMILTFLALIIVLLQPGFFVADVANIWVDDLSEIFNTTCYVGSVVIVWEWVDHILILERKVQAQSVLGRPIYEDDQEDHHFAKYALRMQDAISRGSETGESGSRNDTTNSASRNETTINGTEQQRVRWQYGDDAPPRNSNKVEFNEPRPLKNVIFEKCSRILDGVVYYTDHFIVKGLVIKTLSIHSKSSSDDHRKRKAKVRRRIGLDRPNDVYVYATRDVVFDSDEDGAESTQDSSVDEERDLP